MTPRSVRIAAALAVLAAPLVCSAQDDTKDKQERRLDVHVDPRVELMSVIFRLAGNPEYNMPNSASPYADDVAKYFADFRDHPVIAKARELRARCGISYDAVMSMAVHLRDAWRLREKVPFDKSPERLDSRWTLEDAREFLDLARDFVKQSRFDHFTKDHEALYEKAAQRMSDKLNERGYLDWFDEFFGPRKSADFSVICGLLAGGGNYGVGVRFTDGREEISPILGVWKFDGDGVPVIDDSIVSTVVHEFCHSYTNPITDAHEKELEHAGKELFSHCKDMMERQAYGNWLTMMRESLVRACVVRYRAAADGERAAKREAEYNHDRGFRWTGDFADLLKDYEANRDKYPTFEAFMPRVIEFFNNYADNYGKLMEHVPQVISMTPENGATGIDPTLDAITITFNMPMRDGAWSVVGGGPNFPELAGKLSYDSAHKVLTIPVRLKSNWSYTFWLNSEKYRNFVSADGTPLEPVHVTFETGGG